MEMFIKCWKHCADFSSRASRTEYWMFFLTNSVCSIILAAIAYVLMYDYEFFSKLTMCYSFAAMVPGVAVCVRRLHDIGRSGWFFLIILIPVVGLVFLFLLMLAKGDQNENEWGSPVEPVSQTQQ